MKRWICQVLGHRVVDVGRRIDNRLTWSCSRCGVTKSSGAGMVMLGNTVHVKSGQARCPKIRAALQEQGESDV